MIGNIGGFAAQQGIYGKFEESLRINSKTSGQVMDKEQRQKVAEEFAALLFFEVIKAMRTAIPKGGLFEEDSMQQDIYTSLADMEISRAMARSKGGLGAYVENALKSAYERSFPSPVDEVLSSNIGLRIYSPRGATQEREGP